MHLISTRDSNKYSFIDALYNNVSENNGLFLPSTLNILSDDEIQSCHELPFIDRSIFLLQKIIGDESLLLELPTAVRKAFNFSLPLVTPGHGLNILELTHGPTLAFKDFGARFLAQMIALRKEILGKKTVTVLTATSGDTGAAVAHAFYKIPGVRVCVLYPKNRISKEQEHLFCTLGENIETFAVNGTFDDCQKLVKQCFACKEMCESYNLVSANSINIARLYAQIMYYFELAHLAPNLPVIVPSGNFGNLTAGIMAKQMGARVGPLIGATNVNDTIPRYLQQQIMSPNPTQSTLSNAMDVSIPSNWERIEYLCAKFHIKYPQVISITDNETQHEILALEDLNYQICPHGAVACAARRKLNLQNAVILATAHPAKFANIWKKITACSPNIPGQIATALQNPLLSKELDNSLIELKFALGW